MFVSWQVSLLSAIVNVPTKILATRFRIRYLFRIPNTNYAVRTM